MRSKPLAIIVVAGIIVCVGIVVVWSRASRTVAVQSSQETPQVTSVVATTCQTETFADARLQAGETTLTVALAKTSEQHKQGLSYCDTVPEGHGMYFVFSDKRATAFWMRGMKVPLDMVWIADNTVIGINRNVPIPVPGATLQELPIYNSPGEVDHVLEIGAGMAEHYGITEGTTVKLLTEE